MIIFPRGPVTESRSWQLAASATIHRYLARVGCILFRGFDVDEGALAALVAALPAQLATDTSAAGISLVRCTHGGVVTSLIDLRELGTTPPVRPVLATLPAANDPGATPREHIEASDALALARMEITWERGDLLVYDRTLMAPLDVLELQDIPGLRAMRVTVI